MHPQSSPRRGLMAAWGSYWQQTSPEEDQGLCGFLAEHDDVAQVFWAGFSPLARVFVWFELRYGMESQLMPEAKLAQQLLQCGSVEECHQIAHEFSEQRKRTFAVRSLLGLLQSPQRLVEAVR